MWFFAASRWSLRSALLLCLLLVCAHSARATGQVANMSETLTTSDSVTALKNCKPVTLVETHVGRDSLVGRRNCSPVGIIETHVTKDSCTASRLVICRPVTLVETDVTRDAVTGSRIAGGVFPSENLTTADSVSVTLVVGRSMTENLTTVAAAVGSASHSPVLPELLTTTASVFAAKKVQPNLIEIVNTSDSATGLPGHLGSLSETLAVTDSLLVTKCGALQEFLTALDAVAVTRTGLPNLTENLTTSASLARSVGKAISDTVITADLINAQKPGNFSLNLNLLLTTSDTLSRFHAGVASLTESRPTGDSLSGFHAAFALVTDNLNTIDSLNAFSVARFGNLSDAISTTDQLAVNGPTIKSRSIAENLSSGGLVTAMARDFRSISETISVADAVSQARQAPANVLESLPVIDVLTATRSGQLLALITETLHTNASMSVVSPHAASIADPLVTVDFITISASTGRRRITIIDSP